MARNTKKQSQPKKIPPCSSCGSRATTRSGYGWGAIKVTYDESGKQLDIDTGKISYTASSVIRCAHCKVIRRDVQIPASNIIRR